MRILFFVLALAALTPTPANAAAWVAYCFGRDAQYMQEIGGVGFFHIGQGDGTYETQRLNQTFYDGNVVCGMANPKAPQVSEQIAQVCADKTHKTIFVLYQGQGARGIPPKEPTPYCDAKITVH